MWRDETDRLRDGRVTPLMAWPPATHRFPYTALGVRTTAHGVAILLTGRAVTMPPGSTPGTPAGVGVLRAPIDKP
jgi:hypothetical protein